MHESCLFPGIDSLYTHTYIQFMNTHTPRHQTKRNEIFSSIYNCLGKVLKVSKVSIVTVFAIAVLVNGEAAQTYRRVTPMTATTIELQRRTA